MRKEQDKVNKMINSNEREEQIQRQRLINLERREKIKMHIQHHAQKIQLSNMNSREQLKEMIKKGIEDKFRGAYIEQ